MVDKNSPVFLAMRPSGMLAVLFLVIVLCLFVIPVPVLADYNSSGIIDYHFADSTSYPVSSATPTSTSIHSDRFAHRFTDAKLLNRVMFYGPASMWYSTLSYTKNDVSVFTATVDGVYYGEGLATVYEDDADILYWDIDFSSLNDTYALTLTGNKLVMLVYEDSPWDGVVRSLADQYYSITPFTVDQPTRACVASATNEYLAEGYVFVSYNSYYRNDYTYSFNSTHNISSLSITRADYESIWDVFDSNSSLYFEDDTYSTTAISQDFVRKYGVYAEVTFNTAGSPTTVSRIIDINGTVAAEPDALPDDSEYNITTELDEYSPGDTVNVTYTTDQKGTIQVVKTISGDIYHSIGFITGATNATWEFYIAGDEPYGFYDVYLLDSSNSILDSVRYSLLPTTSSLDILQSSVDLHETFVVFAQTVNESILSIENPDGVEVWNVSIGALMYDYIYYTPTIKTGIYTAYLYDDSTLNDTVMVYLADPPIIDDPLDPETNGSIVVEDVLGDDETMTEYYNEKFRDFAPTIWGFFMLMCLLFLMSILTSFNSGGKK